MSVIDNKNDKVLRTYLEEKSVKGYEIEIRLRDIDRSIFYKLLSNLHTLNFKIEEHEDTVHTYKDSDIRYIEKNSLVYKQEKNRSDTTTFDNHRKGFRIAITKESPEEVYEGEIPKSTTIRNRKRTTFIPSTENNFIKEWKVDMTIVTLSGDSKRVSYEIEMEYMKDQIGDVNHFLDQMWKNLYALMTTTFTGQVTKVYSKYDVNFNTIINGAKRASIIKAFISLLDRNFLVRDYSAAINKILNKPITLEWKELLSPAIGNYDVIIKKDGERYFMVSYFNSVSKKYEVYLISTTGYVRQFDDIRFVGSYKTLIIDGELMMNGENAEFYAFDLLYANTDLRNESFSYRYSILSKSIIFNRGASLFKFTVDTYYSSPNVYVSVNEALDKIKHGYEFETDGIIFQSRNGDYHQPIYKWKPLNLLSVDFYVDENGTLLSGHHGKMVKATEVYKDKFPTDISLHTDEKSPINRVGEFSYDEESMTWKLMRIRYDKTFPNSAEVFYKNFMMIKNPILEQTVRGHNFTVMRKWYNKFIKMDLLNNVDDKSSIIDIGTGRGSDLMKWIKKHLSIFVVEPSLENIKILEERIDTMKKKPKVLKIINAKIQDTDVILNDMKSVKTNYEVDAIIAMFSLTFVYESEKIFDNFVNTLKSTLRKDGLFIGIMFDGKKVTELMGGDDAIVRDSFIVKKNNVWSNERIFGNEIVTTINDETSMVKDCVEYITNFDHMVSKLADAGIKLVRSGFNVDEISQTLPLASQEWTSLNRYFIFKNDIQAVEEEELIEEPVEDLEDLNIEIDFLNEKLRTIKLSNNSLKKSIDKFKSKKDSKSRQYTKVLKDELESNNTTSRTLMKRIDILSEKRRTFEILTENDIHRKLLELEDNKLIHDRMDQLNNDIQTEYTRYVNIQEEITEYEKSGSIDDEVLGEKMFSATSYKESYESLIKERNELIETFNLGENIITQKDNLTNINNIVEKYMRRLDAVNSDLITYRDNSEVYAKLEAEKTFILQEIDKFELEKNSLSANTDSTKYENFLSKYILVAKDIIFRVDQKFATSKEDILHLVNGYTKFDIFINKIPKSSQMFWKSEFVLIESKLFSIFIQWIEFLINTFKFDNITYKNIPTLINLFRNVEKVFFIVLSIDKEYILSVLNNTDYNLKLLETIRRILKSIISNKISENNKYYVNLRKLIEEAYRFYKNNSSLFDSTYVDKYKKLYNKECKDSISSYDKIGSGERRPLDLSNVVSDNNKYVIIGQIGDGSCLFHSILSATYDSYIKGDKKEKMKIVAKLRSKLAEELTLDKYQALGNGNLSESQVDKYLVSNKVNREEALNNVYLIFKNKLSRCKEWASYEMIEYVMNYLDLNIFFVSSSTKDLYQIGVEKSFYQPNRPSIIIYYIENIHFELVGRLTTPIGGGSQDGELAVQTIFSYEDPLIQKVISKIK